LRYLLFFIGLVNIGLAQTNCNFSITGKIVSEADRNYMCFADIVIKETNVGTAANADGYYRFDNLCPGKYTLVCTHVGYFTQEIMVELTENTALDFYLKENEVELHGFTLEEHDDKIEQTQSSYTMEGVHLDKNRGATLGETMKRITGVFTLNTGNSIAKPILHGMHSKRLLILNNGVRQEGQQWGQEHGPEIDQFVAKKITVIKGSGSVRYGSDAIAGVILVEPAAIIAPAGIRGELYINGNTNGWGGGTSLMLEGSFKKLTSLSWRLQGSFKKSGDITTPGYGMANTGVEEYNFSGGLGYYKEKAGVELFFSMFHTKLGIFSASHFGNLTDLNNALQAPQPLIMRDFSYDIGRPYQDITHYLAKAKAYFKTGRKSKLEMTFAYQENRRDEFDSHKILGESIEKPALSFVLQTLTGEVHWEHSFHKKLKGAMGVSGLYQTNRWDGFFFIPNFRNINGGIYWFENLKLGKWDLEAGLRYDMNHIQAFMYVNNVYQSPVFLYHNLSANVGAMYHHNDHFTGRINYGLAWRPPHVSELFSNGLHHGSASYEVGDATLLPEKSNNINVSFAIQYPRFKMEFTGFYYYIQDYIYLKPTLEPVLTIRGAFPGFKYTAADVDIKGFDVDMDIYITPRLLLNSKTSLLWAWNYSQDDYLIQMPPFRFDHELSYQFKDTRTMKNMYLSASALAVTQQTMVPQNSDYLAPPAAYCLLGLNAGVDFIIKQTQTIAIGISITNVLDNPYRDYLNRFRYFSNDMGRNVVVKIRIPLEFNQYKTKFKNQKK
jgi:iron complex outermembrane receptor protein